MQATPEQIDALLQLQEIDRRRLRATMQRDSLPQPAQITEVRTKRAEVEAKRTQVESLLSKAEAQMARYVEEDEQLETKQASVQQKIDDTKGDYRQVASLTRDLDGIRKRRETLEFEMGKLDKRIDEISVIAQQAGKGVAALSAQEKKLQESLLQETAALNAEIEQALADRQEQIALVGAQIMDLYDTALSRCGGVGVALLNEGSCSACRNVIEPNRLLQVTKEAPLSTCPHCRRMLVVR